MADFNAKVDACSCYVEVLKVPAGSLVQIASTLPPAGEMVATTKTQETGLLRVSEQTDRQTDRRTADVTHTLAQEEQLYVTRWKQNDAFLRQSCKRHERTLPTTTLFSEYAQLGLCQRRSRKAARSHVRAV